MNPNISFPCAEFHVTNLDATSFQNVQQETFEENFFPIP